MKFKILVFDFDGTIANTLTHAYGILNQLSFEYGFKPLMEKDLSEAKNMNATQLIRFLKVPKRKIPLILAKGRQMLRHDITRVQLCEGMEQTLNHLNEKGWYMGIITSNSVDNVQLFLSSKNLHCFNFISSVGKLSGKHKHIRAVLRTFSLKPENLLFIGDETRDVKAAKKLNVPVAACTWGFNNEEALMAYKPDFLVKNPAELMEVIHAEGLQTLV